MGIMSKILGALDPATGRGRSGDPRMKGAGRGRTTRGTRGKVPPGSNRFGMYARRGGGRGRASSGRGKGGLLGALRGRH
jgi:hypothetical protein